MTKTTVILLALSSFALGFFASELRRQDRARPAEEVAMRSGFASETSQAVDRMQNKAPAAVQDPATDTAAQAEAFSWERVQQLIAAAHYEEAIRLLRLHLADSPGSAPAWFLLAQAYEKQDNHEAALDAWFHYLEHEVDVIKRERAALLIKAYLVQLYEQPSRFGDNPQWLIAQLDALSGLSANDGELHLILASLYAQIKDDYQAQYHALMAANDPLMQKRAEEILAQLNGSAIPDHLSVPLVRFGNQYLVNVIIEGFPASLLLDTGASISGVSNSYVARHPSIVKSTKPIQLNTASGVEDSYLFTVDTMTIDSLVFKQHILALLPMNNMTHFDGLLGVDILGRFDFVIDQDALSLKLQARKK